MKNPFIFLGALALMSGASAFSAHAENNSVENALKSRPDLSTFYQALVTTGVNRELSPHVSYTVFAPTNDAIARISTDKYPCFYMVECRDQVAQILRNHIVPGEVYVEDAARQKGAIKVMSGRFVNVGEPSKNNFAVDGNNTFYMSWLGAGGILYKIDGVIANPRELASVQFADYAYLAPQQTHTTTQRVINDPACGPAGCPDATTTTVTRTTVSPPMLAPSAGW